MCGVVASMAVLPPLPILATNIASRARGADSVGTFYYTRTHVRDYTVRRRHVPGGPGGRPARTAQRLRREVGDGRGADARTGRHGPADPHPDPPARRRRADRVPGGLGAGRPLGGGAADESGGGGGRGHRHQPGRLRPRARQGGALGLWRLGPGRAATARERHLDVLAGEVVPVGGGGPGHRHHRFHPLRLHPAGGPLPGHQVLGPLDVVERTEYLVAWERDARWVEAQRMKAVVAVAGATATNRDDFAREHVKVALSGCGGSARAEPPQPESATLTCSRAKSSRLVAVAPATATTAFIRCASNQRAARSQATRYSVRSTSSSRWIWTWVSRSMATGPGVSTPTIANFAAESLRGPGGSATRTTGDMATANGVASNMCSSIVEGTDRIGAASPGGDIGCQDRQWR